MQSHIATVHAGGSVQHGLSAARGVYGFYKHGSGADRRLSLCLTMSVLDYQTVDQCGRSKEGSALLIMYCPGLLGQDYQFEDVAEKAEVYLEFVETGQLLENFPECKGLPVTFQVSCQFWPHTSYKPRFVKMARQLSEYNVKLEVFVSSLTISGGVFDYEA